MEANELRIGNYIINEIKKEDQISGYYIHEYQLYKERGNNNISKYFKPIPLTEEELKLKSNDPQDRIKKP